MRAIAVDAFRAEPVLTEVPKPDPAAGEVRVKIEYTALNPLDWQCADGSLESTAPHVFPLVMGVDFAGRVDMVGHGRSRFRVGDPVFGRVSRPPVGAGTYCEYVCVPQDSVITLVPDGLPLPVAAALPSAGMTAAQILDSVSVACGESLLVIGAAGGVGSCLTQLASAHGIRVLAAVRGDERHRMTALGAAVTIDTTSVPLEEGVRNAFPDGVEALVDLVTTDAEAFAAHAGLVHDGGVAVSTRGAAERAETSPCVAAVDFVLDPAPDLLDVLAAGAAEGALTVPIETELPLEKAPQALDRNRAGGARGKTVFML
ncbi:NADP-dependent oxidoreductase [Streptomyces sp. AM 4-1-1]|uniref:NADP-dependent oxidoreductase n=1 Tax=Streptomyces sp. AM 4-1-1 TaxID=3028710 RepID=UPI0023B8C797|nr:NADP-dependent oxidoreductase [Streptomyces sp. AM 4-1-1]WEH34678.1 NADP-dependent oxidoreductase [Streptomyces sp. AM 4-1-1]